MWKIRYKLQPQSILKISKDLLYVAPISIVEHHLTLNTKITTTNRQIVETENLYYIKYLVQDHLENSNCTKLRSLAFTKRKSNPFFFLLSCIRLYGLMETLRKRLFITFKTSWIVDTCHPSQQS